jgi:hypothetical protein
MQISKIERLSSSVINVIEEKEILFNDNVEENKEKRLLAAAENIRRNTPERNGNISLVISAICYNQISKRKRGERQ